MHHHSSNSNNNLNKTLVNRWIMNGNQNSVQPFKHAPPFVQSPRQYTHSRPPNKVYLYVVNY